MTLHNTRRSQARMPHEAGYFSSLGLATDWTYIETKLHSCSIVL